MAGGCGVVIAGAGGRRLSCVLGDRGRVIGVGAAG
jgi:hypothetical protein